MFFADYVKIGKMIAAFEKIMNRLTERIDTVPRVIHFPVPDDVFLATEARIHRELLRLKKPKKKSKL